MRTDADDLACVRDPAIELLLSHTATLTDGWCGRIRVWAVDNRGVRIAASVKVGAEPFLAHDRAERQPHWQWMLADLSDHTVVAWARRVRCRRYIDDSWLAPQFAEAFAGSSPHRIFDGSTRDRLRDDGRLSVFLEQDPADVRFTIGSRSTRARDAG